MIVIWLQSMCPPNVLNLTAVHYYRPWSSIKQDRALLIAQSSHANNFLSVITNNYYIWQSGSPSLSLWMKHDRLKSILTHLGFLPEGNILRSSPNWIINSCGSWGIHQNEKVEKPLIGFITIGRHCADQFNRFNDHADKFNGFKCRKLPAVRE